MKEVKIRVTIDGEHKVTDVKKEIKDLDDVNKKYHKTAEDTAKATDKSRESFSDLAQETGLLSTELEIVNRIKILYNAGMAKMGATTDATAGATSRLTRTLKALKLALVATGIGAIAVVVGTLASAFLSTQRGVDALNSVLTPTTTVLSKMWGVIQDISSLIVDGKFAQAIEMLWSFDEAIAGAWQDGQKLADMNIKLREATIQWITRQAELNQVISENRRIVEDNTASLEEREQALDRMQKAITTRLKEERELIEQQIEIQKIKMAQNDDDIESREKLAELEADLLRAEKEASDSRAEFQGQRDRIEGERQKIEEEKIDRINRLIDAMSEEQRMLFETVEDERQRLGMLTELRRQEAQRERDRRLNEASNIIDDDKQLALEKEIINQDYQNEITGIEREHAEARMEIAQAEADAKIATQLKVAEALMALSRLAGEQTMFGKALGVASATIDTYVGANKALAQGGIFGIASAVGIIATGLANVRQILTTSIPSTDGGSIGGSASPSRRAPTTAPTITAPDIEGQGVQTVETIFPSDDRPVKAYVVESEITETQKNVKEIEDSATF